MSDARYYLILDGKIAGPYGVRALQEMASVRSISIDTPIAREGSENWQSIGNDAELSAAVFPVAPKHQLKAKVISYTPDARDPVSVEDLLRGNLSAAARREPSTAAIAAASPRPGRKRRRDFIVAIAACNALGLAAFFLLPRTPYILVPLLSYFVLSNIGLYWIYYQVMDRY